MLACLDTYGSTTHQGSIQPSSIDFLSRGTMSCFADQRDETHQLGALSPWCFGFLVAYYKIVIE